MASREAGGSDIGNDTVSKGLLNRGIVQWKWGVIRRGEGIGAGE